MVIAALPLATASRWFNPPAPRVGVVIASLSFTIEAIQVYTSRPTGLSNATSVARCCRPFPLFTYGCPALASHCSGYSGAVLRARPTFAAPLETIFSDAARISSKVPGAFSGSRPARVKACLL